MAKLDLSALIPLFEQGRPFELTEKQYEERIKKPLPQTNYLKRNSPVAKEAKKHGFTIQVDERVHRVLIFTKNEETQT